MAATLKSHPVHVRLASAVRPPGTARVFIGHAPVDVLSFEEAKAAILAHAAAASAESVCVVTPNAQHIVLLDQDDRLREIYNSAALVLADGASLLFAARFFGRPLIERIAGVDLFESLCAAVVAVKLPVFFLGGRPGSADLAASVLRQRYPGLDVQTYSPPMGFEKDRVELDRIANLVRASRAKIVFVAFGSPKQEYWMHEHGRDLGANVLIGIGGSFELVAGVVKRAPRSLQLLGFEWLFRLCMEPRRLWRRYLLGNLQFLRIVLYQFIFSSGPRP